MKTWTEDFKRSIEILQIGIKEEFRRARRYSECVRRFIETARRYARNGRAICR